MGSRHSTHGRALRRIAVALLVVASPLAGRWLAALALEHGLPVISVVVLVPALLAAQVGGLGPGLVTAAITTASVESVRLAGAGARPPRTIALESIALFGLSLGSAAVMASLRRTRLNARASARHMRNVYRVSAALGAATTTTEVGEVTLRDGLEALEADTTAIYLLEHRGNGAVLRRIVRSARNPELGRLIAPFDEIPLEADLPVAIAARTRRAAFAGDRAQAVARFPALAPLMERGLPPAFACVPMIVGEQLVGVLVAAFARERQLTVRDLGWLRTLVQDCAIAMDRSRILESMKRGRVEAQAAGRAKDEFLAAVSRALRAPLASIGDGVRRLSPCAEVSRPERALGLAMVAEGAHAELRLVDDLVDISRSAAGDLAIHKTPVDLVSLVRSAAGEARERASEAQLELSAEIAPGEACVMGDERRLRRVVGELLANAVHFTAPGGHLHLRMAVHGDLAVVGITDDGKGIAPSDLPHVFEPFRRGESVRGGERTGIGLSIAKYVADEHGGSIRVDSEGEGRGTTSTLELPLWRPS
jgi:signal transduction histidine kinase